jgi:hypothetical protein
MSAKNQYRVWMVFLEESDPVPYIEPRSFATRRELKAYLRGVEDSARGRHWGYYSSEGAAVCAVVEFQERLMREARAWRFGSVGAPNWSRHLSN